MKLSFDKIRDNGKTVVSLICCVAIVSLIGIAAIARQSVSTGVLPPNTGTNLFPNGGGNIQTITVVNTNTTANLTVNVYDAPTNLVAYTNAAVTNYTYTTTSTNQVYTNVIGQVQTNTFTASIQSAVTIAANTNNWPLLVSITVPTNNTVTWQASGVRFTRGLLVTNLTTGSGGTTVVYDGFNN